MYYKLYSGYGIMKNKLIASELFSQGNKYYFMDFRMALNSTCYIRISRSDKLPDGSFKRSSGVIFEEDFEPFIQALSSLLHHAGFNGDGEEELPK